MTSVYYIRTVSTGGTVEYSALTSQTPSLSQSGLSIDSTKTAILSKYIFPLSVTQGTTSTVVLSNNQYIIPTVSGCTFIVPNPSISKIYFIGCTGLTTTINNGIYRINNVSNSFQTTKNVLLIPYNGSWYTSPIGDRRYEAGLAGEKLEYYQPVDTSTSPVTLTLPTITSKISKLSITISDVSGNSENNNITINPGVGQTIMNESSMVLGYNRCSVTLVNDGISNWVLV